MQDARARPRRCDIFSSEPTIASSEPCTSDLMTTGSSFASPAAICENICSSVPRRRDRDLLGAQPALAELGDLAGPRLVLDHGEIIAGQRRALETQHLDRHRRTGLLDRAGRDRRSGRARGPIRRRRRRCRRPGACRAGPAPSRPRRGRARAWPRSPRPAPARSGLALRSSSSACSRMASSSLSRLACVLAETSTSSTSPPSFFDHELVLQQLLADPVRVGVRLVDLVDGDDDRHLRRLGVADRLDRSAA